MNKVPDNVNIDCPYQKLSYGAMVCSAADLSLSGNGAVDEKACHDCIAGRIFRELGCKHISPRNVINQSVTGEYRVHPVSLFCLLRKRTTTYEHCCSCNLVNSEFTTEQNRRVLGLFEASGFKSSFDSLTKARDELRNGNPDGCIRASISSLESTLKIILDKLSKPYPSKEQLTDLWKAVRSELRLGEETTVVHLEQIIGSLTGAISGVAGIRNDLSDAHGKGIISPEVYESYAELTMNISGSISTFLIRRLKEIGK